MLQKEGNPKWCIEKKGFIVRIPLSGSIYLNKLLVFKVCRLYNMFSSGARHGPYAQSMVQTTMHNKDRKIELLRGAGTCFELCSMLSLSSVNFV